MNRRPHSQQVFYWVKGAVTSAAVVTAVAGCAAKESNAGIARGRGGSGTSAANSGSGKGGAGAPSYMSSWSGTDAPKPYQGGTSGSNTAAGGSSGFAAPGSAGSAGGVPEGCEVGKFCVPFEPDAPGCGTLTLVQDVEVTRTPGNLLLVFDQSASMNEGWGTTGQSKLQAAQAAIVNAITALKDDVTVGAIFFPTTACIPVLPPPPGGAVAPIDGPGQIPFQPGPMFLQSWMQHWPMVNPANAIGTPMQEAFDRADVAIANAKLTGPLAVVAVTDGTPNCFPDAEITMTPTDLEVNRARSWLDMRQVKTYVVGLPGAVGAQILTDVAASGGTAQYILPDDPAALEAKLKELVKETVKTKFDSCSINLMPAADPADKLQMVVVDSMDNKTSSVPHMLTATAGWTISADGTHVELTGDVCASAMSGRFSSITFEYPCKPPPPLEPIDIQ